MSTTKPAFEVRVRGRVVGTVKAKDLYCAARQARKKFWPKGSTTFSFAVSRLQNNERLTLTRDVVKGDQQ